MTYFFSSVFLIKWGEKNPMQIEIIFAVEWWRWDLYPILCLHIQWGIWGEGGLLPLSGLLFDKVECCPDLHTLQVYCDYAITEFYSLQYFNILQIKISCSDCEINKIPTVHKFIVNGRLVLMVNLEVIATDYLISDLLLRHSSACKV